MELGVLFSMLKWKTGNQDEMRAGKCQLNERNNMGEVLNETFSQHKTLTGSDKQSGNLLDRNANERRVFAMAIYLHSAT